MLNHFKAYYNNFGPVHVSGYNYSLEKDLWLPLDRTLLQISSKKKAELILTSRKDEKFSYFSEKEGHLNMPLKCKLVRKKRFNLLR